MDLSTTEFLIFASGERAPQGFPDMDSAFMGASGLICERRSFDAVSARRHHVIDAKNGGERHVIIGGDLPEKHSPSNKLCLLKKALDLRFCFHWDAQSAVFLPPQYGDIYSHLHNVCALGERLIAKGCEVKGSINGDVPKWPQPISAMH